MGGYHPTLPDDKALELLRAALDVRKICVEIVKGMHGPGAPRYGMATTPPPLKARPCTESGLELFIFDGLPMDIGSAWGTIQISDSCTAATPAQTKEILRQLVQRGVRFELEGNPDTEAMMTAGIKSVNGVLLPPVQHAPTLLFPTFSQAARAFEAACAEAYRRR